MLNTMSIIGLDLAGVETRPTGYCTLLDMKVETSLIYTDAEILSKISQIRPRVVAIDAPLSLPPGRKSLEERNGNHLRECDRELLKKGIKFFPVTLGPMRKLTERGIRLKKILEQRKLHYFRGLSWRSPRCTWDSSKTERARKTKGLA